MATSVPSAFQSKDVRSAASDAAKSVMVMGGIGVGKFEPAKDLGIVPFGIVHKFTIASLDPVARSS